MSTIDDIRGLKFKEQRSNLFQNSTNLKAHTSSTGVFKNLVTLKIHAVSKQKHLPSNEDASHSTFQTTYQHQLGAWKKKKLAKKCPNYIVLRVQNTATQLRMDCKTVSRVSRQASSYKDCNVSRDLSRIGKDRLQVNKQCIQINKNSVSIFIRLSCNSYGADESAPLSLLKLLGRTKDERTLSVTGLTTGSKAGWGPRQHSG